MLLWLLWTLWVLAFRCPRPQLEPAAVVALSMQWGVLASCCKVVREGMNTFEEGGIGQRRKEGPWGYCKACKHEKKADKLAYLNRDIVNPSNIGIKGTTK